MYRDFNHATRLRRTPGYSCIWLMQQCMVTVRHVRTVDSDIVVLALWLSELWVGFGTGKKYRDIPVHSLHAGLGPSKFIALTLFHSLTGCDTTSQFLGCGKKTAWAVWNSFPDLIDTLVALTLNPNMFDIESIHMQRIERFVVLMYSKGCGAAGVNEARLRLFTSGTKSLESIPPTQAALFQHVKRAILQSSFYWHQALSTQQEIPDFNGWGWQKDEWSGNRYGPPSTMLQWLVRLCCIVVATRLAREDASAIEPAYDALPSANAKADALTTRAEMTSK